MGIELPSPQSEYLSSAGNAERTAPLHGSELARASQSVEINATEAPASQELRTSQPASDVSGPVQPNDVTTTAQSPSLQSNTPVTTVSLDDVPVVAADEDLIEKQWVDSVKRIVKETRSDPYSQGQAIGQLQADYLQKRYGKTLTSEGNA